jgi:hypothetical protein
MKFQTVVDQTFMNTKIVLEKLLMTLIFTMYILFGILFILVSIPFLIINVIFAEAYYGE